MSRQRYLPDPIIARKVSAAEFLHSLDPEATYRRWGFAGIRHIENQGFARAVLTGPIFVGHHPAGRLWQPTDSHDTLVVLCANLVNHALGAICHHRAANDLKAPTSPRDAP